MIEKFNLIEEKQYLLFSQIRITYNTYGNKSCPCRKQQVGLAKAFSTSIFFLKKPLNELFLFRCLFKT